MKTETQTATITWTCDDGCCGTARLDGNGQTWSHSHSTNSWRLLEHDRVPWFLVHAEDVPDPVRRALCPASVSDSNPETGLAEV